MAAGKKQASASVGSKGTQNDSKKSAKKMAEADTIATTRYDIGWWAAVVLLTAVISSLHRDHIFHLFESDKHFSHLSNLEREMAFRTEMGLYYSYFKTIIHAPSFYDGIYAITNDNVTEYPDTINTLKRFNLYPEVVLGAAYRYASNNNWLAKQCFKVNRGKGLDPVPSCEGLGEPTYFYVHAVMLLNGWMMGIYFLFGTYFSGSIFGGLITVAGYIFNHGEATRVMWTPPLRESFAFPTLVTEMFFVTHLLKKYQPTLKDSFLLACFVVSFMLPWQFAQFALMTQLMAVFGCYALGFINKQRACVITTGLALGLLASFALLFGNEMLLTSFFASCILTVYAILAMEPVLLKLKYRPIILLVQGVILLSGMVSLKQLASKILKIQDDAHISDILKSKFSDFKTFDTLLYTCAKEFDFLEYETYTKLTQTGLIPTMLLVVGVVTYTLLSREFRNFMKSEYEGRIVYPEREGRGVEKTHAEVVYNVLQMCAFIVMAVIIMRLKLFATPQLCLICSLVASKDFFGQILPDVNKRRVLAVGLIAAMAIQGSSNIMKQRSIRGEYSNVLFEQLIEWINKNTAKDAVFGGPMPTMANIKLSTLRPIINHPHYEDVGIRARTKKIYTMTSRKTVPELYDVVLEMKAEYIVYEGGWCLRSGAKPGCTMPEIWDVEDPANAGKEPLCLVMKENSKPYFTRVYANKKFEVYRINKNLKKN